MGQARHAASTRQSNPGSQLAATSAHPTAQAIAPPELPQAPSSQQESKQQHDAAGEPESKAKDQGKGRGEASDVPHPASSSLAAVEEALVRLSEQQRRMRREFKRLSARDGDTAEGEQADRAGSRRSGSRDKNRRQQTGDGSGRHRDVEVRGRRVASSVASSAAGSAFGRRSTDRSPRVENRG